MKEIRKGFFFAIEGIDGSGKTTQINLLAKKLEKKYEDREIFVTSEPTNSEIGQLIRKYLKRFT